MILGAIQTIILITMMIIMVITESITKIVNGI